MARYIEFSTPTDHRLAEFARGNPVHDGVIPPGRIDVDGVRVHGELITFQDATIPDTLHRTLYEIERLKNRMVVIDCLAFVALMSGENLSTLPNQSGTLFPDVLDQHEQGLEIPPSADPLYLVRRTSDEASYVHAVYPAHTVIGENYLHKLGVGPVAMSTLVDAAAMYPSQTVQTMPVIKYDARSY